MNSSGLFKDLIRHEFRNKGSWRKQSSNRLPRSWRLVYFSFFLIAAFTISLYFALHNQLELTRLWYVTLGLPYMIVFMGVGTLRREWENDTYGWWLTLPYPRMWLISAKWIAAILQTIVVILILFVVGSIYALFISSIIQAYTFADAASFMIAGLNWFVMIIGFTPLVIAVGLLTASTKYSTLRPLSPILWILLMGGGSIFYWSGDQRIYEQFDRVQNGHWFPFTWHFPVAVLISWIVAYVLVRLNAYLLEKKLSL
ncbi:ABC transporter permease subunit [Paenibacillus sp. CMAA1739]|uniref:ABC transporter permease subunit n=1 Tax=Paenibacillus ottowii TaxID=2315729 RepID=UPI002DB5C2D9|nr:ABC transporter permease subunit [Paenibacillus sp. CMAA1739]MEC4567637.1 ABC transporter permease subunit [Paenibacillus sp. CMAA1739]